MLGSPPVQLFMAEMYLLRGASSNVEIWVLTVVLLLSAFIFSRVVYSLASSSDSCISCLMESRTAWTAADYYQLLPLILLLLVLLLYSTITTTAVAATTTLLILMLLLLLLRLLIIAADSLDICIRHVSFSLLLMIGD